MLNKFVTVTVDRPLGSFHPKYPDLYYPVNYGYIKGVMALDGEEQDAYILGICRIKGMLCINKSCNSASFLYLCDHM